MKKTATIIAVAIVIIGLFLGAAAKAGDSINLKDSLIAQAGPKPPKEPLEGPMMKEGPMRKEGPGEREMMMRHMPKEVVEKFLEELKKENPEEYQELMELKETKPELFMRITFEGIRHFQHLKMLKEAGPPSKQLQIGSLTSLCQRCWQWRPSPSYFGGSSVVNSFRQ